MHLELTNGNFTPIATADGKTYFAEQTRVMVMNLNCNVKDS